MRKNHNRGDHIVGIGRRARMADLRGWHLRAHAWLMGVGGTCARGKGGGGTLARGDARSRTPRMWACIDALGAHGGRK